MTKIVTGCILLQYVELDGHDPATLMGHRFLCSGFCSEGEHTLVRLSSRWSQAVVFSTGAGLQWLGLAPFSGSLFVPHECDSIFLAYVPGVHLESWHLERKKSKAVCWPCHKKSFQRGLPFARECVRKAWTLFRPKSSFFWHALWNFSLWNYGYR